MLTAWYCNSGEDDNTKTPKIVTNNFQEFIPVLYKYLYEPEMTIKLTLKNEIYGTGQPYRVSSLVSFKEGVVIGMTVQFHIT